MSEEEFDKRARTRELAKEFAERGDALGWFEELYREAAGDNEKIPWADLEPNRFLRTWAEKTGLRGDGRTALVVGCGLGDDAVYLDELGFEVTGFDISSTAIEWARRLHAARDIEFEVADLFSPPLGWTVKNPVATAPGSDKNPVTTDRGFDFVLEVYTIQPLPIDMRERVMDSIAAFVAPGGELVVVTRGREDDEEVVKVPWPVSRKELSRFEENGLVQTHFEVMPDETDDEPADRYVVVYRRDPVV
ncbi:MAG: class I SAM-dependent methyltransferase [bacterium]|nr:class I SAM-dependent methyltransferase [bacterium]